MGDAPIEERVGQLEKGVAGLKKSSDAPKPKDGWDKLQSLSTVLSGVIIAAIGIWVNHSLVTSQERAQAAQATATQEIERSHNQTQEVQQAETLALQKQQAKDNLTLEQARQKSEEQRAAAALQLQREQSRAALELQESQNEANLKVAVAQIEENLLPGLETGSSSGRIARLEVLKRFLPTEAIKMAAI
jgi:hypothetical protein